MEEMAARDPHTLTPTPPQGSITNIRSARSPVESAVCEWGCRDAAGEDGSGTQRTQSGRSPQRRQGKGWAE